ncbi:hypothetical protein [uncultured Rikenella sp.]|uniref:hypothetical protein n=1 Tax=uncultured Rikenella sp. TaxID=368003 RepID=UPI00261DA6CF|nr:hypothetical protein [uncultured Rikenella sp.]
MPSGTAPGYRGYDKGTWVSIGNDGCCWSSTSSSTNKIFLYFTMTGLNPSSAHSRAFGLPLRCLSE